MAKRKKRKRLIQAVTHIALRETNQSKLATLDAVADAYKKLCQEYTIYFCQEEQPDKYAPPHIASDLSQRWQRVAIMQAAGIAKSWRSNRDNAYAVYDSKLAWFQQKYPSQAQQKANATKAPKWREFNLPDLKKMKIEANRNVAQLSSDDELAACTDLAEVKDLLLRRHQKWRDQHGYP